MSTESSKCPKDVLVQEKQSSLHPPNHGLIVPWMKPRYVHYLLTAWILFPCFSNSHKTLSQIPFFTSCRGQLEIFRTDPMEGVGSMFYAKYGSGRQLVSGCMKQGPVGFMCHPDVGTNAKLLLIGTLFFLVRFVQCITTLLIPQ